MCPECRDLGKVHYNTPVHLRIMVGDSFESELSEESVESDYSSKCFILGLMGTCYQIW